MYVEFRFFLLVDIQKVQPSHSNLFLVITGDCLVDSLQRQCLETTPHGNLEKRTKLISEDRNCWCNFLSSCLVPSYKCCLQSFIQLAIKLFLEVLDDYVELLVETDALGRKLKEFLKVFVLSFLSRFLNFGLDIKTEYSIKIFLVKL